MKQFFFYLMIAILFMNNAMASINYIGDYNSTIVYHGDSTFFRTPYHEMLSSNGKVKITLQHEIVTAEKSSTIKNNKMAESAAALSMAFSSIAASTAAATRNPIGYLNGVCTFKRAESALYVAALNRTESSDIFISLTFENVSDDEISINNAYNGSVFYILPGETIVFNFINDINLSFRMQFNLSNPNIVDTDRIEIISTAVAQRVDRECYDSKYWIIKGRPKESPYQYCLKGYSNLKPFLDDEYFYYVLLDLETYKATPILIENLKETIKKIKDNYKEEIKNQ